MSEANPGYIKVRAVPGILFALLLSFMIPGCGGGDKASTTNPPSSMPPPTGAGTEFADLNPANAGYAATAAGRAADARPRSGSVTQSSNVNSGVTVDRVTVTAQYGAARNSYSVRNGSSWSIGTSDGNPVSIPGVPAPFKGSELTKRVGGGTLYVDVYSDIEAPNVVPGGGSPQAVNVGDRIVITKFPDEGTNDETLEGTRNDAPGTFQCPSSSSCSGVFVTESQTGRFDEVQGMLFTPDTGGGIQQEVSVGDAIVFTRVPDEGPDYRAGQQGTRNGVPGTFRCSSNCSWEFTAESVTGHYSEVQGIVFIPSTGTTVTTPDADYLAGGVWLFVPDGATSADDVVFGAFADGSDPFRQSNLMALQGTARYDGAAAGVYSARSSSGTELGYWDGAVTLMADFGGQGGLGTIGGSLTDIVVDDEPYSGSLNLGAAPIGSSNSGFFEGLVSGTVEGSAFAGRWGGQFFGNGEADGKPGSVAGTLGGRSMDDTVNIVGAFGAHKQ